MADSAPARTAPGTDKYGHDGANGGWCNYCPDFTYHRLTGGACGTCVARFREFPNARPTGWSEFITAPPR